MKPTYLFFFFLWILYATTSVQSQDTTHTWIDMAGNQTSLDSAELYRLSWREGDLWRVNDYFKNDTLQMSGIYADPEFKIKAGRFKKYNENGELIEEFNSRDNYYIGAYYSTFEDGTPSEVGVYMDSLSIDQRKEIFQQLNKAGGLMPFDTLSVKTGEWNYYHYNGVRSAREIYNRGKIVEAQYWDEDGSLAPEDAVIEQMPEFPGGEYEMMRFLGNNIKYPKKDKRAGTSGTVKISFVVDQQGYVTDSKIFRSVSPAIDAESLRVVNAMPRWSPGKMHNRMVKVQYYLPINFSLR